MKPMRIAETIEQAIDIVRIEHTECQLEWYSLGKTREQLLEYLERDGINPKALGVFISGRFDPPWIGRLTFMPIDFVLRDSAQSR